MLPSNLNASSTNVKLVCASAVGCARASVLMIFSVFLISFFRGLINCPTLVSFARVLIVGFQIFCTKEGVFGCSNTFFVLITSGFLCLAYLACRATKSEEHSGKTFFFLPFFLASSSVTLCVWVCLSLI